MMRCIRTLFPSERPLYEAHLLRLDPVDRRLRFGFPIGDEAIRAHVLGLDLARDRILVQLDDRQRVVGAAHIARTRPVDAAGTAEAEIAFTVDRDFRSRGLGSHLFRRAVVWARNRGIRRAHLHYLNENTATKAMARRAGMAMHSENGECEASLDLLPATPITLLGEAMTERWGLWEYSASRPRPGLLTAFALPRLGAAA